MPRLLGPLCGLAMVVAAAPPAGAVAPRPDAQQERIPRLLEQLGDDDPAARDRAERALRRVGEPALDALLKALKDQDLEVRLRAGRLLPPACAARAQRLVADLG